MTDFTVYGIPGSPYVRSALLGFEEKGAPYRFAPLAFGAQRSPEHLTRHPFGKMPVVDHGDFRLYETQAILRYLDRLFPNPPLVPTDPKAEARMNQVVGVTDCYIAGGISGPISFPRLVAPRFGLPVDEAAIAEAMPRAAMSMDEIGRLLGDKPYMAGDQVSIADLMLGPHVVYFAMVEEAQPMFAKHPNLAAWVERLNARPSFQATTWERVAALAEAA